MGFGPSKEDIEALKDKMRREKEEDREYEREGTLIIVKFKHNDFDVEIHGEILQNIKERIAEVKMDLK